MSKIIGGTIDQQIDQVFNTHFASVGKEPYPIQRTVIHHLIDGHNTLALMPTGSGKSLCYWVAGRALNGVTLVIFPLTALMDEQAEKLTKHGCKVYVLHSGINGQEQFNELVRLYNQVDSPDFIFISPERLATDGFFEFVIKKIRDKIKLVVVDEAHCISQWGFDFRPFYKDIPGFLHTVFAGAAYPTILCMTATLNPKDREEVCMDFEISEEHVIQSEMLLRFGIDIKVVKLADEKIKNTEFWSLLERHRGEKMLVYRDQKTGKNSVQELSQQAVEQGYKSAYFHADLTAADKSEIIRKFKSGELQVVFATSAFGMGIDIPDIRGVIHHRVPESIEQYYQQIGRVGRDRNPAWAVLFYTDKNINVYKTWFIEKNFPNEEKILSAFRVLTNLRIGKQPIDFWGLNEEEQSAYHYFVRGEIITPVCKAVTMIECFKPAKNVTLPDYETYQRASPIGLITQIAKKTGKSEAEIIEDVYRWLAERKLIATHAPAKCIVIQSMADTLSDDLLATVMKDIAQKKQYRLDKFNEFVQLLGQYKNSDDFHQRIGDHLGIDKFNRPRILRTVSNDLVRSKSEVIVADILFYRQIPFRYEEYLVAPDGSRRLPDFTITWKGKTYYWEHLGMLDVESYECEWRIKEIWYKKHFPGQLITTVENSLLTKQVETAIDQYFS